MYSKPKYHHQAVNTKPLTLTVILLVFCLGHISATHASNPQSILILGDSLSAAYGIKREDGWVNLLDQHLKQHYSNQQYPIINASISGETTGGALRRLPQLLAQHQPAIVIIELGGNDGLRGHPINILRQSLQQLVELSLQSNATVLLAGMKIPPNYGLRYTQQFYDSYQQIAQQFDIQLVPFLLAGIALKPELIQSDGIHPTAAAQPQLLKNVLPSLKVLLNRPN